MDQKEQHLKACDARWAEVMKLAEANGFILGTYGGVATLATHKNQMEELGLRKYLQIQKMNGHCPKRFGYEGCLDEDGQTMNCGSCCLCKKGIDET